MATTEVHRTLVKSPPELWAELSDQDSLARHLSEFGEIRITSTVAESTVHWESDEATGTALIKQAGWGTKVSLRATVRASEQEREREATPVLASAHPSAPATPPATAPATASGSASALATQGPASTAAAQSPVSPLGAPGPLTAAGLRDSDEPSTPSAWAAATGSRAPVEASRPPAREPAFAFASPRAPEPDLAHETPAFEDTENPPRDTREDGAPEPTRLGLFARLFGRRTRRSEEHDQTPERPEEREEPRAEPVPTPEPAEPTALEALQARFAARPQVPETPSVPADPVIEELPTTSNGAAPDRAADPSPDQAAADPAPDQTAADHADDDNLSSELRRAEETAAGDVRAAPTEDQVKEILTGVLDRLGAAHHRPFSRA